MKNGGELLVQTLVNLGATKSFGVPGESYLPVLDAMYDTQGKFDFVLCRNEGGASFMASAYGKLTRTPGICFVTRGPGATNASIGVHTAMQDSSPMILFVGQIGTEMREREAFQEVDYRAVFGTMVKWATEIEDTERVPEMVARAWKVATSGRPGPVVVALPENTLNGSSGIDPILEMRALAEPSPDAASLADARALLERAERPLMMLGGSMISDHSHDSLTEFNY